MAVSEAKKRANNKWVKENYKRVTIAFSHDEYAQLENHCKKKQLSKNSFLREAALEKLEREK